MAKIPLTFNIGDKTDLTPEELLRLMEQMYMQLAQAINKKPDVYQLLSADLPNYATLSNGDINIDPTTQKVEMLTKHVSRTVVQWTQLS
jgi:arsenate reductase-like glutaredoxin family protein